MLSSNGNFNIKGATIFQLAQDNGQTIEVAGFLTPDGHVSLIIPQDYIEVAGDKFREDIETAQFEFDSPDEPNLEDCTIYPIVPLNQLPGKINEQSTVIFRKPVNESLDEAIYENGIKNYFPPKRGRKTKNKVVEPVGSGPFTCELCNSILNTGEELKKHLENNCLDKEFGCSHCSISFNKKINLKLHEALHDVENLVCPECQKVFSRIAAFKAHLAFHEEDDTLLCWECGEEFEMSRELQDHFNYCHKNKETPQKPATNLHSCTQCNKLFSNAASLASHKKEHSRNVKSEPKGLDRSRKKKRKPLKGGCNICTFCDKKFYRPSQLVRHLRVHTGEKPFVCGVCESAFNQKGALQIHLSKHSGYKPFDCPFCSISFTQKGNLLTHINKAHSDKHEFKCSACPCTFNKSSSLHCHMTRFHEWTQKSIKSDPTEELLETDEVDDGADELDILQKALRESGLPAEDSNKDDNQDDNMPLKVNITEVKTDGRMVWYTVPLRYDGKTRWYVCTTCDKECRKPSDLIRHFRIHTKEKPFKCDICFRSFSLKPTLITHMRTHDPSIQFNCEKCKKQFGTLAALNQHIIAHELKRPCLNCGRNVVSKNTHICPQENTNVYVRASDGVYKEMVPRQAQLLEHSQSASNEDRPHQCQQCLFRFRKSSHLKQHMMGHNGMRPFQCNVCLKTFSKYGVLKSHIKTHLGLKPYSCKVCERSFSTRGSVKRHCQTQHSEDRPYMCPHCQNTFKTSNCCKRHMNSSHKLEILLEKTKKQGNRRVFKLGKVEVEPESMEVELEASAISLNTENKSDESEQLISQSFLADDAATLTLPSLSKESIQEFEQTLNQQFFLAEPSSDPAAHEDPKLMLGVNIEVSDSVTDADYTAVEGLATDMFQILPDNNTTMCGFPVSLAEVESRDIRTSAESENEDETPNLLTCDQCGWQTDTERALMRHLAQHFEFPRPRTKRSKVPVKEFTEEETAEIATTYLGEGATESERILVAAAVEKLGKVPSPDHTPKGKKKRSTFRCDKCTRGFTRNSDLIRHKRTHTGERPFECEQCNRRFTVKSTLVSHMRTHTQRPSLICHVCNAIFSARSSLKVHMRLHTGARPFECNICKQCFRTSGHLKNHFENHNVRPLRPWLGDDLKTIDCLFTNPESVINMGIDEKENVQDDTPLPTLGEALVSLPDESVAQLLGDGDINYVSSEVLDAGFTVPLTNKRGRKKRENYDDVLGYTCQTCDKSFSKPSLLMRHERVHSGVRPYSCDLCGARFNQKHVAEQHMKAHNGQRKHECPYCSFSSVQKSNLKTHIGRLHQFAHYLSKNKEKEDNSRQEEHDPMEIVEEEITDDLDVNDDRNLNLNISDERTSDLDQVMGDLFPQV